MLENGKYKNPKLSIFCACMNSIRRRTRINANMPMSRAKSMSMNRKKILLFVFYTIEKV